MLSKLVKYTDLLGSYEILLVRIDPGSIHSRIGRQTVKFSENSSDLSVKKCSENFFVGSLRKPLLWELFSWEQFKNHCSHNFSERAEEDLIGLKKTQSEWEQSHCSEQNERPLGHTRQKTLWDIGTAKIRRKWKKNFGQSEFSLDLKY